jgi:phosphate acetyltransferase
MFLNSMCEMVRGQNKRVVYPEGREERAIRAAGLLRDEKLALPTLLGDPDEISKRAKAFNVNLDGIDVHDYLNAPQMDTFVETYFDLRMHKGISLEFARERMSLPHFFGAMMVRMGAVDGMVSGLNSETKPFIPAFEIIKLKPGFKRASSLFVLEWPERLLFFADCSVNIDPDAQTLCDIAEATAQTVRTFGYEPRIAFLSFSTRDSAKGASVEKVKEATRLARTECPSGTVIDGEIQFDAALLP